MSNIISIPFRWISQKLLSLIFILGVLIIGGLITSNFKNYQASNRELPKLESLMETLNVQFSVIQKKSLDRVGNLKNAPLDSVNMQLKKVAADLEKKQIDKNNLGLSKSIPGTNEYAEYKKLELEILFLQEEKIYLAQLSTKRTAEQVLEALKQKHIRAYRELKQFDENNPIRGFLKVGMHKELYEKNHMAYEGYQRQLTHVQNLRALESQFKISKKQLAEIVSPLNQKIDGHKKRITSWLGQGYAKFPDILKPAIWILILATLSPVIFRATFYFILAPLASRQPPVCIFPNESGAVDTHVQNSNKEPLALEKISAVSIQLNIDESQELLIHPDYVQSSSIAGRQDTKWLLSNSFPLSSILSGMLALSRIRTDNNEMIVISSTNDPLSEVAMLSLPKGAAMVLQPRSLIGVLQNKSLPVQITRHWRLFSLHAWLTLQLRYLVFHGPAKLIIKGCRGVRAEKAGNGRRVSQSATIGFSANLKYTTTRCETFFPYLTARQSLLNDSFIGEHGLYVYDELPRNNINSGITTRGLEGGSDAMMKVFGI